MAFTAGNFLLVGSILLFVSIFAGKTGYRFGMPVLLLFLVVGMVFGSAGFGIQFSSFRQAQFIGMTALSIILFSGGMDTKGKEIQPVIFSGTMLATVGVVLTALFTGIFAFAFGGTLGITIGFSGCMLLASIMSSTDSASVFSILRSKNLHLGHGLRPVLELESGSNDPMAYMLTIMFIQMIQVSSLSFGVMIWTLVIQFVLGIVCGYIFGRLAVFIMNHINLDYSALYVVLLLAFVLFIFSSTDFMHGNGYLAVYIAGLVVGNNKMVYKKSAVLFFDGLAWLSQIIMFLTLGLLVNPEELLSNWLIAVCIGVFMIIVARPLSVFLCLLPFKNFTTKAKLFISWVGLRGAVPIIFATYPCVAGVPHAREIFNIVFFITIISLVVQGTTVPLVARLMGLTEENYHHKDFAIDMPEDIAITSEIPITKELLSRGDNIQALGVIEGTLPIMLKRAGKYIIPNVKTKLEVGDKLLLISKQEEDLVHFCQHLNITNCEIYKED